MFRLISLSLVLLVTTGCSFRKLAFRNADLIASYEADRFFDPKGKSQNQQVESIIDDALARTRSSFLPRANVFLAEVKASTSDPLSEKEWQSLHDQAQQLRRDALTELLTLGAPFLVTLDKKQLTHLQNELEESNEDLVDLVESKNFEKKFKQRQNRTMRFYKDLIGSLTNEQKDTILKHTKQSREQVQQHLNGRREMQKSFVALIGKHRDATELQKSLQMWIDDPKTIGSADYEVARRERAERNENLMLEMDKSLSEKQRHHMLKEIDKWMKDFEQMAAG